jgi:hypothetical protein
LAFLSRMEFFTHRAESFLRFSIDFLLRGHIWTK